MVADDLDEFRNVAISLPGTVPSDSYTNPDMSFTISKVDNNTLRVHFDEDAAGKPEVTDQVKKNLPIPKSLWLSFSPYYLAST